MTQFLEFASSNPVTCCILAFLALQVLLIPSRLVIRTMRHIRLMKHGWPPEHVDADGDFKDDN